MSAGYQGSSASSMAPRFAAARSRPTDGAMAERMQGSAAHKLHQRLVRHMDGGWRRMGAQGCCLLVLDAGWQGWRLLLPGRRSSTLPAPMDAGPGTSPIHAEWLSYDKTSFKSPTVRYPDKLCSCQLYVCTYIVLEWALNGKKAVILRTWSSSKRT